MSQQFHAWGHMKKSQLPAPIIALQVCFVMLPALQVFMSLTASSASAARQSVLVLVIEVSECGLHGSQQSVETSRFSDKAGTSQQLCVPCP